MEDKPKRALKKATDGRSVVHDINEAEKVGRDYLINSGASEIWLGAINTYLGKGEETIPGGVNVKINRLRPDIQTINARHMKYLLGSAPYMPLEAKRTDEYGAQAQIIETVLNDLAVAGGFYQSRHNLFQIMLGLGHAYSEPRWGAWVENIMAREPVIDPVLGTVISYDRKPDPKVVEGLHYIERGPWEVMPHPHGNTMREKPYIVVKENLHYSEIQKMVDMKVFTLPDDVTTADLRKGPQFHGGEEWETQWSRDKSLFSDEAGKDIGVFLRLYENPTPEFPRGRWAYSWNYWIPLLVEDNMNTNMRLDQKPLIAYRDVTHIGPDRFLGQGIYEQYVDKMNLADDMRSFHFNEILMRLNGWLLFDPEVVDRQNLDATFGNRIAIKSGHKIDQAIFEVPRQPLDGNLMEAADRLDQDMDSQIGTFYPQTGEPAPRKETFGTTQLIAGAGDIRMEAKTRLVELTSFEEEALYSAKLVDANISRTQLEDMVGEEKADMVLMSEGGTLDPQAVPGGVRWKFQGSVSIAKKAQEDQQLIDWWNLSGADPEMQARHIPKRKLAKATGRFTDEEIDQMYPTPEEQGYGPNTDLPQDEFGSLTEEQAIANPDEIRTPALNNAINAGV